MILGTVALPVYNSPGIAWLSMESLCRQEKPENEWELIIFEEQHIQQCGKEFFEQYEERLGQSGCIRLVYLSHPIHVPLSIKWRSIALASSATSEYLCLCGVDDYKHSKLLIESEKLIRHSDWGFATKSYFYDFSMNKVILYDDANRLIGPQMTARTGLMRKLPEEPVKKAVDTWISNNLKFKSFSFINSDGWKGNLCTNGLNNISLERISYFKDVRRPFVETDTKLNEIVPKDIAERLFKISQVYDTKREDSRNLVYAER